jgi:hypothetical protein
MAKFFGVIGYGITGERAPGVYEDYIIDKNYFGDILQFSKRNENGSGLNDNIVVNNKISIVADAFAYENFINIKYVSWLGVKWKVTNVEVQHPRLFLTVGGVYNE